MGYLLMVVLLVLLSTSLQATSSKDSSVDNMEDEYKIPRTTVKPRIIATGNVKKLQRTTVKPRIIATENVKKLRGTTVKPRIIATRNVKISQQEMRKNHQEPVYYSYRKKCFLKPVKKCRVFKVNGISKLYCISVTETICYALDK